MPIMFRIMFCYKIVFVLLIGGSSSIAADADMNHVTTDNATSTCAGKKDAAGELCDTSACRQLNVSCPLIPNVLCASDECGCRLAFTVVFDHLGRGGRKDVSDLCQVTAAIKASTEIMNGLLSGTPDKRSIVVANPRILFLIFKGLNTLSMDTLKRIKLPFEALYSQQPTLDNYQRLQFYITAQNGIEKRISQWDLDRKEQLTNNNTSVGLKELERRDTAVSRWIDRQEKVVQAKDVSTSDMLALYTRIPSRKYALDHNGHIAASRWPVYRNIILDLLEWKTDAVGSRFFAQDSDRKMGQIRHLLAMLATDEVMAARQAQTKIPAAGVKDDLSGNNTTYARPYRPVSNQTSRAQYSFSSFAPLFTAKTDKLDLQKICDLFNHAIQIAALSIDLYKTMFDQVSGPSSDQEIAKYVEDWNIADDLTEGCF